MQKIENVELEMFIQAEKEIAQARVDIAHEVRLAKEAEAQMDLHVTKAGERAEKEIEKHSSTNPNAANPDVNANPNANATAMPSKDSTYTAM